MKEPLVSVIIPNYNYGRFLEESIGSALNQTYPNVEVIVVDDGSTDDSVDVANSFNDRIRFISQENAGVSAARNRGIAESRGEVIAFLDSDDVWLPEKLEKQMRILEKDPDVGLVHCGYIEVDSDGKPGQIHVDGMSGQVAIELLRYRRPVILGGGSAAIVRRSIFDRIGGFDPNVSPAEDWEFYYRCARICKVGFVAEILMKYREHQSNAHLNIRRMEKAILGAFDKSFSEPTPELQSIRNACYGKIHSVLAGSYFRAGQYGDFLKHALRSLRLSPAILGRYVMFPFRSGARRLTRIL